MKQHTQPQTKPDGTLVRYRRPLSRKGSGWHYGRAVDKDVNDDGLAVYTIQPIPKGNHIRITEPDVEEVTE